MQLAPAFVSISFLLGVGCATGPLDDDDGWDFADGKSDSGSAISYGALAQVTVPPAFDAAVTGLAVVDADVMPHEVKAVRKQLAALRDQLDLFAYAYTTKNGDRWDDIRDDLDDGYETLGAFKDLFDRQGVVDPRDADYDPAELAELRAEVVAWTSAFRSRRASYRSYLAAPSQTRLYDRDRDDLSGAGSRTWRG
jgi:hypothetical protein